MKLLTVQIRNRYGTSVLNLVTSMCPLRRIAEHRDLYPQEDMVLLAVSEIEDEDLARWCLYENGGEVGRP